VVPPTPSGHPCDAYRGLVDAAPDAYLAVDASGAVVLANPRAQTLFGRPGSELVGSAVEAVVPGVFGTLEVPGGPWSRGETAQLTATGLRPDGSSFPLELSVGPVRTAGGLLAGALLRDVSGRVAVERASERMREELLATVSHELRTPLTSIMGYTEILVDLDEPTVSEEAKRILSIVRRNAERQLKVVEDLLMLTLLGGGGVSVDRLPTDLGPVLRSVLAEVGSSAAEAGVAVIPSGVRSVPVFGDATRLREVLECLVTSAVRFSRAGDRVDVRLLVEGDHGVVEVCDRGGGTTPPGADPLTGLGSPVLRGIVEAHAGHLGVDHDPGRGTTVRVLLPLAGA